MQLIELTTTSMNTSLDVHSSTLNDLYSMSVPGVYAVINSSNKRIYIAYAANVSIAIATLLAKAANYELPINDLCKDIELGIVSIKLLRECKGDTNILRGYAQMFVDKYKQLGYSMYRDITFIKYSVKTSITTSNKVIVELVKTRNSKVLVGVFNNMIEANNFITENYKEPIYFPVYSSNDLTKSFLE